MGRSRRGDPYLPRPRRTAGRGRPEREGARRACGVGQPDRAVLAARRGVALGRARDRGVPRAQSRPAGARGDRRRRTRRLLPFGAQLGGRRASRRGPPPFGRRPAAGVPQARRGADRRRARRARPARRGAADSPRDRRHARRHRRHASDGGVDGRRAQRPAARRSISATKRRDWWISCKSICERS